MARLRGGIAAAAVPRRVACAPEVPIPRQPHPIIIIDIDTLRADHLGGYGYHRDTSPAIDAFASESVFFEWAFSQAPNTPPSQTSILTGLYPSTHGMIYDDDRVPEEVITLAEALVDPRLHHRRIPRRRLHERRLPDRPGIRALRSTTAVRGSR